MDKYVLISSIASVLLGLGIVWIVRGRLLINQFQTLLSHLSGSLEDNKLTAEELATLAEDAKLLWKVLRYGKV